MDRRPERTHSSSGSIQGQGWVSQHSQHGGTQLGWGSREELPGLEGQRMSQAAPKGQRMTQPGLEGQRMSQAALEEQVLVFKAPSSPKGPSETPTWCSSSPVAPRARGLCAQLCSRITNSSFPAIIAKSRWKI